MTLAFSCIPGELQQMDGVMILCDFKVAEYRNVNKDLNPKDHDKDKDLTPKDSDYDKNLTPQDNDLTPKDKDLTPKDQNKNLKYVLNESLRTRTRTRTTTRQIILIAHINLSNVQW